MANSAGTPRPLQVNVRLDDNPGYKGSSHDDETARKMGFRAALIPGAFVYGHMSRVAIIAWGSAWAAGGTMKVRFRRPVYNGDTLTFNPTGIGSDHGQRCAVTATNQLGEVVADGEIGLPDVVPIAPAIDEVPLLPLPDPRPLIAAGAMREGVKLGSTNAVLTAEDVCVSRDAFDERHPIYQELDIVHSGCLVRRTMFDCHRNFAFPQPVIFTAAEAQHFHTVQPGQKIGTSGRVVAAYERKGRHYFESEEFVIVDDRSVAARFRRTSLYA